MHPLLELRRLLRREAAFTATVLSVGDQTAVVGTRAGSLSLDVPPGLSLTVGDRVRVEGSVITGRLRPEAELPVYRI